MLFERLEEVLQSNGGPSSAHFPPPVLANWEKWTPCRNKNTSNLLRCKKSHLLFQCYQVLYFLHTCFAAANPRSAFSLSSSSSPSCSLSACCSLCVVSGWPVAQRGDQSLLSWPASAVSVSSRVMLLTTLGSAPQVKPFSFSNVEEHRLPAFRLSVSFVSEERRQVLQSHQRQLHFVPLSCKRLDLWMDLWMQ